MAIGQTVQQVRFVGRQLQHNAPAVAGCGRSPWHDMYILSRWSQMQPLHERRGRRPIRVGDDDTPARERGFAVRAIASAGVRRSLCHAQRSRSGRSHDRGHPPLLLPCVATGFAQVETSSGERRLSQCGPNRATPLRHRPWDPGAAQHRQEQPCEQCVRRSRPTSHTSRRA